jgi:hypothetical protein
VHLNTVLAAKVDTLCLFTFAIQPIDVLRTPNLRHIFHQRNTLHAVIGMFISDKGLRNCETGINS